MNAWERRELQLANAKLREIREQNADLQAEMSECARKFSEWQRRYPLEVEADPEITDVPTFNLHGTQDTHDFRDYGTHELKRGEGPYMNVETQSGDLDIFSRPLRPGS